MLWVANFSRLLSNSLSSVQSDGVGHLAVVVIIQNGSANRVLRNDAASVGEAVLPVTWCNHLPQIGQRDVARLLR